MSEVAGVPPCSAPPLVRHASIDWLRGVVMMLMALDHVRYFFTDVRFAPENIERTSLALFLTRWVTHFCAPVFFFLAGTSSYLSLRRRAMSARGLLAWRGALLMVLELTIVGFAWQFTPGYSFAGVLWALGWSMIFVAALAGVRTGVLAAGSLVVIVLSDPLIPFTPERFGSFAPMWSLLHVPGPVIIAGHEWYVLYSIVPWSAVMLLGYSIGPVWSWTAGRRQRCFIWTGTASTLLFLVLRITNSYGNPSGMGASRAHFVFYHDASHSLISLLNVAKYPPSLQFLMMTLGPSLVSMALAERFLLRRPSGPLMGAVLTFGRVPMFYYLCHLYLIHVIALLLAHVSGQPAAWLGWRGPDSAPEGYGYGLAAVYAIWGGVVLFLYPACRAYERVKRRDLVWTRFV
ncbi:MAG: heparan-alpha-glucosaminide N-acetyltransferase domain-containing protein [Acidobacteriota bacterium]